MLGAVALRDDLDRVAQAAMGLAAAGESLLGIVPAEAAPGERRYLCAFGREEERTWLVLDDASSPVIEREAVRRAASIAAMCELAEDSAGGGELDELRERLVTVRLTEAPPGIEEAEAAALELAAELARGPLAAHSLAKLAIDEGMETTLAKGLALEQDLFAEVFGTEDAGLGVRSFKEHGPGNAVFKGK
jgi:hypothetical protein